MSNDEAFILTLVVTFVAALIVALYLRQPLRRLLPRHCSSPENAAFWIVFIDVVMILIPLTTFLLSYAYANARTSLAHLDMPTMLWSPAVGLVFAVIMVAVLVSILSANEPVWDGKVVARDKGEELTQLLSKVDALRAREIVEREAEAIQSTKP